MMIKHCLAVAAATAAIAAVPASAASISFTTSQANQTWSSGNVSVFVSAWTAPNGKSTTSPTAVGLGQFGTNGLGVTAGNTYDAPNTTEHTIDNRTSYDYVVLQFSEAVSLTGMTLEAWTLPGNTTSDKDAWVSFTKLDAGTNSLPTLWTDVLKNMKASDAAPGANNVFPTSFTTTYAKSWLIGASMTDAERNDAFKLKGVSFNVQAPVPEPATWMTMILGFGLIGGALRRRRQSTLATA